MATDSEGPGRYLSRGASLAAATVAVLSLVYAVFYLFVAPSAQRKGDVDAFFTSYLAHPTGLRVASLCLFVSGLLTTVVYAALHATPGTLAPSPRTWILALGVVSGVATTVHGLADLVDTDKLAHTYGSGDAATRAAAAVAHATISQVDPRGLATFGIVGLVVFAFSRHVRQRSRFVGLLGQRVRGDGTDPDHRRSGLGDPRAGVVAVGGPTAPPRAPDGPLRLSAWIFGVSVPA